MFRRRSHAVLIAAATLLLALLCAVSLLDADPADRWSEIDLTILG